MAEMKDLAKVSWEMGNSPGELLSSYVSLAKKTDLAEWMNIFPKEKPEEKKQGKKPVKKQPAIG